MDEEWEWLEEWNRKRAAELADNPDAPGYGRLIGILERITGRPFARDTLQAVSPVPINYRTAPYHPNSMAWVDPDTGGDLTVSASVLDAADTFQDEADPERFIEQILSHEVGHLRDMEERPWNKWLEPFRGRERVAWENAAVMDALRDVPREAVVDSAVARSDRWMERDPRFFFPMPRWIRERRIRKQLDGIASLLGGGQ